MKNSEAHGCSLVCVGRPESKRERSDHEEGVHECSDRGCTDCKDGRNVKRPSTTNRDRRHHNRNRHGGEIGNDSKNMHVVSTFAGKESIEYQVGGEPELVRCEQGRKCGTDRRAPDLYAP